MFAVKENSRECRRYIVPYRGKIRRDDREKLLGQRSFVLWFTGLSGSGKSTIAHGVEEALHKMGKLTYVFDGDNIRSGLCSDLSFSPHARSENLRRVAEVIKLFLDAGVICLAAFISPFEAERRKVRKMIDCNAFYEVYVKCPLEVCESRDTKGLYRLAREGKIKNYTGISSPYEEPASPDLTIDTSKLSIYDSIKTVLDFLETKDLI
ncbi:MAG TPA: adenylyl-sulfate kinase [Thermodesulforhabdus norvegica]|uniref:Adenylyl-sulfate kinase n=1 Tax=Thermodesulforhabdus norvegica TaxID=39841 RepID=A0A7C0WU53_9BACT|nr:adenylyl-sulfate kinase [Deltaproteobacteria bacterium]MBW2068086.1 adenylyl-sulfate kinase [Deltaproteobacteria bacterium]HDL89450.1 adenylyl-sulfate kinase [Thermodesulforhabdus norvegica]